jgi:hypothetical protein
MRDYNGSVLGTGIKAGLVFRHFLLSSSHAQYPLFHKQRNPPPTSSQPHSTGSPEWGTPTSIQCDYIYAQMLDNVSALLITYFPIDLFCCGILLHYLINAEHY